MKKILDDLLAHLSRRMMTWTTTGTLALATAESIGVKILSDLGGLVEAGEMVGAAIWAGFVAAAAIWQNYLNREK